MLPFLDMEAGTFYDSYAKYGFWIAFIGIGLCQLCMLYICCRACCCSKADENSSGVEIQMNNSDGSNSMRQNERKKKEDGPPKYDDLYPD